MNSGKKWQHLKLKNVFVKPENVVVKKLYAFNYNPEAQPKVGKLNSVKEWWELIEYIVCGNMRYCNVKLYCEISSTGRYHFHGYIRLTEIYGFYTIDNPLLVQHGTVVMKEIENDDWEDYILKQQYFMQTALQKELYGPLVKFKGLVRINNIEDSAFDPQSEPVPQ